jgi:hypothetical protein
MRIVYVALFSLYSGPHFRPLSIVYNISLLLTHSLPGYIVQARSLTKSFRLHAKCTILGSLEAAKPKWKKYQLGTRLLETTSNVSISDVYNKSEMVCSVKLYTNSYMCLNATLRIVVLHARKIRMWHSNIRENSIDWEISIVGSPWQIGSTQANT